MYSAKLASGMKALKKFVALCTGAGFLFLILIQPIFHNLAHAISHTECAASQVSVHLFEGSPTPNSGEATISSHSECSFEKIGQALSVLTFFIAFFLLSFSMVRRVFKRLRPPTFASVYSLPKYSLRFSCGPPR